MGRARRCQAAPAAGWRSLKRSRACPPWRRCRRVRGFAAICPNRYGSSTMARKKSTVCSSGGALGKAIQRSVVRAVETDHDGAARLRLEPLHHSAELRPHGTLAAQPPQRIGLLPASGSISRQFAVTPHPAPVDPVLQLPQKRAIGRERAARRRRHARPRYRSTPARAVAARRATAVCRRALVASSRRAAVLAGPA